MPKIVAPLHDTKISSAKPAAREYTITDGGGLLLLVKPNGKKNWQLRYTRPGVRAAYVHRAEFIRERERMMRWWSDFLEKNKGGYVPPWEFTVF